MDYQARRDRLRKSLKKSGADALLVTNFANVTYLTGFTGEDSYLLVREDSQVLISDGRFTTQLEEECPGLDVDIRGTDRGILSAVLRLVQSTKTDRLAIEGDSMTVGSMNRLAEKLPQERILPTSGLVEKLRQIKDKEEVTKIREAVWYAEKAFGVVRSLLRPEQTEKQIADELENQFRRFGGGGASFPPIVAVGERSALPHANPTDKQVGEADFVLIDWGAQGTLYKSDLTRVLVTGKILPKLRRVYEVVLQAQTRAIAAIRPGVVASEIDAVARGVITDAGFGRRFNHGLGHGVGLDIHEAPRLSRKSATVLRPGMVITVEPGVYLPGWGGVRIEDDVLVTRTGHEVLTHVPKQLDEMVVN